MRVETFFISNLKIDSKSPVENFRIDFVIRELI